MSFGLNKLLKKNRIKRDYHTALAGFADWYFNIFPNGDNVADNDERKTLLTQNNAPSRYFDIPDKAKFVKHMEDVDIDKNILFVHVLWVVGGLGGWWRWWREPSLTCLASRIRTSTWGLSETQE